MSEHKKGRPGTEMTRREFLKKTAQFGAAAVAAEVVRKLGLETDAVEAVSPEAGSKPEFQIDLPPNTYLSSLPEWQLKFFHGVKVEDLELHNGPKRLWSLPEFAGIFVVPSRFFANRVGADEGAREKLKSRLVVRTDIFRDEKTDQGWEADERVIIQEEIILATRRCLEALGPSRRNGLVLISRPSMVEREAFKKTMVGGIGGAVLGGDFGCSTEMDIGRCGPDEVNIVLVNSLKEMAKWMGGQDIRAPVLMGYIKNLISHEIGHVFLGNLQLGTTGELGALDNHAIVYIVGASVTLSELARRIVGRYPEELNIGGLSYSDLEKPEMVLWKTFKVRGREFYADLLKGLRESYGDKQVFETKEVSFIANALFQRLGFKFSYEEVLKAFGTAPDESKIVRREMANYRYPTERVANDPLNPGGEVCWWEEVKVLAPVPFGTPGWFRGPIFPDDNGYYRAYKQIGKGPLKNGPPNKNSLAVATWKKGGGVYGSPIPFPPDLDGVEFLRSKNY